MWILEKYLDKTSVIVHTRGGKFIVGRRTKGTLEFDYKAVSRSHANFTFSYSSLDEVTDPNKRPKLIMQDTSTYGSWVNGKKLENKDCVELKDGDGVCLGVEGRHSASFYVRWKPMLIVFTKAGTVEVQRQICQEMAAHWTKSITRDCDLCVVGGKADRVTEKTCLATIMNIQVTTLEWFDNINYGKPTDFPCSYIREWPAIPETPRAILFKDRVLWFAEDGSYRQNRKMVLACKGTPRLLPPQPDQARKALDACWRYWTIISTESMRMGLLKKSLGVPVSLVVHFIDIIGAADIKKLTWVKGTAEPPESDPLRSPESSFYEPSPQQEPSQFLGRKPKESQIQTQLLVTSPEGESAARSKGNNSVSSTLVEESFDPFGALESEVIEPAPGSLRKPSSQSSTQPASAASSPIPSIPKSASSAALATPVAEMKHHGGSNKSDQSPHVSSMKKKAVTSFVKKRKFSTPVREAEPGKPVKRSQVSLEPAEKEKKSDEIEEMKREEEDRRKRIEASKKAREAAQLEWKRNNEKPPNKISGSQFVQLRRLKPNRPRERDKYLVIPMSQPRANKSKYVPPLARPNPEEDEINAPNVGEAMPNFKKFVKNVNYERCMLTAVDRFVAFEINDSYWEPNQDKLFEEFLQATQEEKEMREAGDELFAMDEKKSRKKRKNVNPKSEMRRRNSSMDDFFIGPIVHEKVRKRKLVFGRAARKKPKIDKDDLFV